MSQTYTYTISIDFPNGVVDVDTLSQEIDASSISSGVLEGVTTDTPAADTCYIQFDLALSAPDVTTLDGIVAAHTGVPNPVFETSDSFTAQFVLDGASDNGMAALTVRQNNIGGEWLYLENAVDGTAVGKFRQTAAGHPRMLLDSATGTNRIKMAPEDDSFVVAVAFGIGTDAPDPTYAVDISGDVNTDAAYRVAGTAVITANRDLTSVRTANFSAEYDNGTQGPSGYTVDWNNGQKQVITLGGSITLSFTAPAGTGNFLLRVVQDATGSRIVTWPGTVLWAGGVAPTLSTAANAVDIVTFYYNGTNYYGVASLNFA